MCLECLMHDCRILGAAVVSCEIGKSSGNWNRFFPAARVAVDLLLSSSCSPSRGTVNSPTKNDDIRVCSFIKARAAALSATINHTAIQGETRRYLKSH